MSPTPLRPRSSRSARAHDALRRERHTASSNLSPVIFPCDSPKDYAHTSDPSQTMARLSTCQPLPRLWPDNGLTRPRTAPDATTARTHAHATSWDAVAYCPTTRSSPWLTDASETAGAYNGHPFCFLVFSPRQLIQGRVSRANVPRSNDCTPSSTLQLL